MDFTSAASSPSSDCSITIFFTGTMMGAPLSGSRKRPSINSASLSISVLQRLQHRFTLRAHTLDSRRKTAIEDGRTDGEGICTSVFDGTDALRGIDAACHDQVAIASQSAPGGADQIERIGIDGAIGQKIDTWTPAFAIFDAMLL